MYMKRWLRCCREKPASEASRFSDTIHAGKLPDGGGQAFQCRLLELTGHAGENSFTRTALLGMIAAKEAVQSAGINDIGEYRTGLLSATTVGGMDRSEVFYSQYLDNHAKGRLADIVNHDCADSTDRIARHLGDQEFYYHHQHGLLLIGKYPDVRSRTHQNADGSTA